MITVNAKQLESDSVFLEGREKSSRVGLVIARRLNCVNQIVLVGE